MCAMIHTYILYINSNPYGMHGLFLCRNHDDTAIEDGRMGGRCFVRASGSSCHRRSLICTGLHIDICSACVRENILKFFLIKIKIGELGDGCE